MSRIVVDARFINSSTGRYCLRLLQNLEKIDHKNEYIVLIPRKDKNYYVPKAKNFRVEFADWKLSSFGEQFAFNKFLKNLKADLVHFCIPQQPIFYRKNKITTMHDLTLFRTWNSNKNWLIYHAKQTVARYVFWRVARDSARVICPSEFTARDIEKFAHISPDEIDMIYEAADYSDKSAKSFKKLKYKKFLLYVGQQTDYKNLVRLAKAHQKLLKKFPDLGLVFVGRISNTSQRGVKSFTENNNYKNIQFTGYISDKERNYLYQNAAAYVFPSLMEGFGLPALEAMINGAPVISSNATCLPEVCGNAAEYFDPKNIDEMANVISRVLSDDKLRAKLIKLGYEKVKEYSWEKCARETLESYEKVLKTAK